MDYFFTNFPVFDDPTDPNDPLDRFRNKKKINLLTKWDKIGDSPGDEITIDQIADTIQWLKTYLTEDMELYIEDLEWTHKSL
eukprot:326349-Ditylum_brightwellii.AAC.1